MHKTVSEAATKLFNRYGSMIDGAALVDDTTIQAIRDYISNLSDDSEKNKAAKRCIERIAAPGYTFTDPVSQVTMRELLALTFLAINDEKNRLGSLEDAQLQFVEGLYEIQRGNNLSEIGVDQGGEDDFICDPGIVNKLVEKLQSIHPDCVVHFITKETAALKLPCVVREEVMGYLSQLAGNVTDLSEFTQLIEQLNSDGVEVIWDEIVKPIAERMFDEFGSLFRGREDRDFTAFIAGGEYTPLGDLSLRYFQRQIQDSPGYHQYCSQLLRRSSAFFPGSREQEIDYLSEYRHDDAYAQRRYDKRCGVTLTR